MGVIIKRLKLALLKRARSLPFWIGIVSGGAILAGELGYQVSDTDVQMVINVITWLGFTIGVWNDPTTKNIGLADEK